jgi:hypothetical protein
VGRESGAKLHCSLRSWEFVSWEIRVGSEGGSCVCLMGRHVVQWQTGSVAVQRMRYRSTSKRRRVSVKTVAVKRCIL